MNHLVYILPMIQVVQEYFKVLAHITHGLSALRTYSVHLLEAMLCR